MYTEHSEYASQLGLLWQFATQVPMTKSDLLTLYESSRKELQQPRPEKGKRGPLLEPDLVKRVAGEPLMARPWLGTTRKIYMEQPPWGRITRRTRHWGQVQFKK